MASWALSVPARILALPILLLLVTPVACSNGDDGGPAGEVNSVDGYLDDLPGWFEFSPERPAANEISGAGQGSVEMVDGIAYDCLTTPYSITATPERIVTLDPDVNIL